ncbi:hypothetical protein BJX68DRAFT_243875 [Aspergillus pseudodeflectus]|uniref:Ankyrin repeat-containing domain protein n=1 Tax=Aspergillus pseudodeflectus TaxID=176178 RepID=A0ABR4JUB1_9EURO
MRISRIDHLSRVPHCQVRIQTWKLETGGQAQKRRYEELSTRIDIQPELEGDPEQKPYISVYIKRFRNLRYALAQPIALGPLVIARRTIPEWSPIHDIIAKGDLEGFKTMLKGGKASFWDCDPEGRSLITYAVFKCQPEICKYLIQNGADVDSVEPSFYDYSRHRHLLTQVSYADDMLNFPLNGDKNIRYRANECRILLLRAGADPTIGGQGSALCKVLSESSALVSLSA